MRLTDTAHTTRRQAQPRTLAEDKARGFDLTTGDHSPDHAPHSPIRAQYLGVKRAHPNAVLFFRMGDFYEMFDEDAELVARELELTLTRRDWGRGEKSAMAGVPHHAAEGYIARLVAKGYRVAVCEQVSDPALAKGLVEREVLRVVTPGTIVDPAMLAAKRNNYLAAAVLGRNAVGLAYADITTGEFACAQIAAADPEAALLQELARVQPAEALLEAAAPERMRLPRRGSGPNPLPSSLGGKGPRGESDSASPSGSQTTELHPLGASLTGRVGSHDEAVSSRDDADDTIGVGPASPEEPQARSDVGARHVLPVAPTATSSSEASQAADVEARDHPGLATRLAALGGALTTVLTFYEPRAFREDVARERLCEQFGVATLEAFGCEKLPLAVRAAGAIIAYLRETQRDVVSQITSLETYSASGFMTLDAHTRRNLELFESGRAGGVKGSLLWVLDATRTPMGGRMLRKWLGEPLLDLAKLRARQDAIADALADALLRARLAPALARMGDLERLINRVAQRIATPRDLMALAVGLAAVEELVASVSDVPPGLASVFAAVAPLADLRALIERAMVDEPPLTLAEGGAIRAGYDAELDTLLDAARNARQWVADLERKERERTGIANLRVGYNKVFGYYLEVTNSQLARVPDDYIRKQTLTTGERYITPDLKEFESVILNAHEKSVKLEQELFAALRARVAEQWAERVLRTARALAELDVTLALAEVAARNNYCRPELDEGDTIHIVAGRHPVVEASLMSSLDARRDGPFVPNDTELATNDAQILLLTGPNMAGKSTYLRQVALIALMAQIGSYVPAEAARIGLVDRIFTRIGAQDDLATGQSTFMVEMVETANILLHATPRSLVILDEIGRGTSTYDGLAIARAIVEYLHNNKRCGAKTLFATHYHELVEVARILPRVRACNVAVTEEDGQVVFLRKIVPGGADKSYGIHVAQLAGIPRQVVRRAEEVLEELERKGDARGRRKAMRELVMPAALQLTLFAAEPDALVEELKALAVDELTPLEALIRLYELQRKARER